MGEPKLDLTENMVNQPGKEIFFAHLASNFLKSGQLEQAIKLCQRGLKKFPTYAQAHYILARCYIRKKLNDEARAELERVLHYDPNHVKAIRDLAGLYFTNGFQDLYKEYLMQLFTLDPMNENVIDEAKKLGEYKLWSAVVGDSVSPPSTIESEPDIEEYEDDENVFVEPENEKTEKSDTVPIFPDKIDLSQFDNVEDDFTTILHGKLEYSKRVTQKAQQKDQDLSEVAKEILNDQDTKERTDMESGTGLDVSDSGQKSFSDNEPPKAKSDGGNDQPSATEGTIDISQPSGILKDKIVIDEDQSEESMPDTNAFPDDEEEKFEQPKIISQTLGEILVSQQKYSEAKAVFEALKEKQPENKALDLKIEYLNKIIGLEKKGQS